MQRLPIRRISLFGLIALFASMLAFLALPANAQPSPLGMELGWASNGSGTVSARWFAMPDEGVQSYRLEVCTVNPDVPFSGANLAGACVEQSNTSGNFNVVDAVPGNWARLEAKLINGQIVRSIARQMWEPTAPTLIFERTSVDSVDFYLDRPDEVTPAHVTAYRLGSTGNYFPMEDVEVLLNTPQGQLVEILINYLDEKFTDIVLKGKTPAPVTWIWTLNPAINGENSQLLITSDQSGTPIQTRWQHIYLDSTDYAPKENLFSRIFWTGNLPPQTGVTVTQTYDDAGVRSNYRFYTELVSLPSFPLSCKDTGGMIACTAIPGNDTPGGQSVVYAWTANGVPVTTTEDGLTATFTPKDGLNEVRVIMMLDGFPFAGGFENVNYIGDQVISQRPVTSTLDLTNRTATFVMDFSAEPIGVLAACAPRGDLEIEVRSADGAVTFEVIENFEIVNPNTVATKKVDGLGNGITQVVFRYYPYCGTDQRVLTDMGIGSIEITGLYLPLMRR